MTVNKQNYLNYQLDLPCVIFKLTLSDQSKTGPCRQNVKPVDLKQGKNCSKDPRFFKLRSVSVHCMYHKCSFQELFNENVIINAPFEFIFFVMPS